MMRCQGQVARLRFSRLVIPLPPLQRQAPSFRFALRPDSLLERTALSRTGRHVPFPPNGARAWVGTADREGAPAPKSPSGKERP